MSTTTYPLGHPKNKTTRDFICTLYHRTYTLVGLIDGLTPEQVYSELQKGMAFSPEGADRTRQINQLVAGCEQNGYIERIWIWWPWWFWWWPVWSGRIRMTPAGIDLCKSIEDGKSYCYKD